MKKLFFVTGETSGDLHAAGLLNELYKIIPKEELFVKAIGSNYLKEAGATIYFDCKNLASCGLTEVIKNLSLYLNLERELIAELFIFQPHILILVDFPGFNLRLVKKVREMLPATKIVYYFPPQVWAWKEGRTKILAKYCDLVLCGLPFEEEFHKKRGVNAFYVGNPILDELPRFNRDEIRNEVGIKNTDVLIGIFPGSRKSELHYMLPVYLKAKELLSKDFPNTKFLIAQAQNIKIGSTDGITVLPPGNNYKLLCASDITWLTSGTVTLEGALYETPSIIGYKSNVINYLLYLLVRKINMFGLPNIIYGEKFLPELKQNEAKAENYYKITKEWLQNKVKIIEVKNKLKVLKERLGSKNASKEAALKIRELIPEYKVFTLK